MRTRPEPLTKSNLEIITDQEKTYRPRGFLSFFHLDTTLTLLIVLLAGFGLLILYSASNQNLDYVKSQGLKILLGFILMVGIALLPPSLIKKATPLLFIVGLIMLVLVFFGGHEIKGAKRWLNVYFFKFQPSEIMKLATPLMLAYFLDKFNLPRGLLSLILSLLIIAFPFTLVLIQPDLGTALVIAYSGIALLFLAGLYWRYIIITLLILAVSLPTFWALGMKDYQKDRVITLIHPESDPLGKGYQIIQSKIAIGSGGTYGKGWQNSTQASLQFLPESTTDFIFAITAEEFGLMGSGLLILTYLLIIYRSLFITLRARDHFFRLMGGTICLYFFFNIFVNIGMVSGILPIVGIPLPFISYGGTSIVTLFISFGIMMNIHFNPLPKKQRIY